jgi:hypothetical protein
MVVLYEDKVVWLEFGLVLHSFGPWFCWLVGYLPLGSCRMSIMLHFLYTLGSFLCNTNMSSCKWTITKTCGID